ncbi:MAG: dienelactone hydrolase family protein [Planctomycetota bacterium]
MCTILWLSFAAVVVAQEPAVNAPATGFVDKTIAIAGREHRYVVYVPPGYTRERVWPLIVFLNGMGECGTDGRKHVEVGLGPAIRLDPVRWPFVVVFPQKSDKQSQWSEHEALVMGTLAATEQEFAIDTRRRFLTGLSQGGAGTWALGAKHAEVWAAIAPVCGYGKPADVAARLKATPIWAFHGIDDKTVPAQQSKDLCAAVEKAGGTPVLTLYENTAHNSWDKAYRESSLAEWLRTIVDHPLAARYLAEPALLASARIEIIWREVAAGGGETKPRRVELSARDRGIDRWVERADGSGAGEMGRATHVKSWHDLGNDPRKYIHDPLRQFARGDLFARLATQAADDETPGHRVVVELAGKPGQWRFTTHVPSAEVMAKPARDAVEQVISVVEADVPR